MFRCPAKVVTFAGRGLSPEGSCLSILNPEITAESVRFSEKECEARGASLADQYRSANPFPHIVLDDFLPLDCLRRVVGEFPERQKEQISDARSDLKTGYEREKIQSLYVNNLLAAFNSYAFVRFLEKLTGIPSLIADPHFSGGGLHETARGGFLKIHADFNRHPELLLSRRLNLIVFLNEDWPPEYGGALELWDEPVETCVQRVEPILGKAVIFNTTETSWHGHPEPLNCPEDRFRRSLALYYFSTMEIAPPRRRTTKFVARPGTDDAPSTLLSRWREFGRDWCPPAIWRMLHDVRSRD